MRKTMIRNALFMLLVTAVFAGALLLYLRSASSLTVGEAGSASASSYTASAEGFASDVTVTATYTDGVLTDLAIDASGETEAIGGAAAATLTDAILTAGSTSGVDAVASATITSDAIFAAFASCEAQATGGSSDSAAGDAYTASAEGFASDVSVSVSYADGAIVSLTIDASGETEAIGGAAAETLTEAILAAGSTDGIDAIASATITSDAIFAALADCADQAGLGAQAEPTAEPITTIEDWAVTAGADDYSASATGFASDITVTVEYADGVILSVTIDATGETEAIGGAAASDLTAAIAIAGSAYEVDAIAGATITSNAVLAAVRYVEDALLLSDCELYTGSATGYSSDVTVTAAYKDGVLVSLSADASGETAQVGGTASEKLVAEILAAGNADGVDVDAYANATVTTEAVLAAFAACEEQVG